MSKDERKERGTNKEQVVFPQADYLLHLPSDYTVFITDLKNTIATQRVQTILKANAEMVLLYWDIGFAILQKQSKEKWGAKVIDRMSYDLKSAFPEMSGFSPRNLKYMRKFAEAWPEKQIVQRTVAQIPWRSNITLLDKLKEPNLRLWYANKVIEHGFGKDMLVFQIESELHKREGASLNNFKELMPPMASDLVNQVFKDPYIFDFLGTDMPRKEYELEQKLIDHIQKFLLELGQGFAFVGRQVHLELGNQDYYIDLLFYHLNLRRFVVVELKSGAFKPEYVSKLNVYQNVVNDVLKHETDMPTIGLLLVREKNKLVVEYSLMNNQNPIGVANWENELQEKIPKDITSNLPTIEEIEKELRDDIINE